MKANTNHSPERHGVILDGHDVKRIKDAVAKLGDGYRYVAATVNNVLEGADLSCAKCPPECMETEHSASVPMVVDERRVCELCGQKDAPHARVANISDAYGPGMTCEDADACAERVNEQIESGEAAP